MSKSSDMVVFVEENKTETKSNKDARKLFEAYEKTQIALEKAEEAVERARENMSKAVETIRVNCGNGPFDYEGRILTIRMRGPTEKKPNARKLAYFVEAGENKITKI